MYHRHMLNIIIHATAFFFIATILFVNASFFTNIKNVKAQDYTTYWTDYATMPTYGNGLSVNTAYIIKTPNELAWICLKTNEGTSWSNNLHIMLGANIDLAGFKWTPIGDYNTNSINSAFGGHFYGNNFAIKNMVIDETLNKETHIGLFGYASNSIIEGINLENLTITLLNNTIVYDTYVGGLIGFNNQGLIKNVTTSGVITIIANQNIFAGGIIGANLGTNALLEKSVSFVRLNATQSLDVTTCYVNTGGLVGENNLGQISNSYSKGAVLAKNITAANRINAGGIVGIQLGIGALTLNTYADSFITIDTTNSGKHSNRVGSLIGYLQESEIRASFYNKTTQAEGKNGVGAVSTAIVTATTGITAQEATYQTTFEPLGYEWDFVTVWTMDPLNEGQPVFITTDYTVIVATSNMNNGIQPLGILYAEEAITKIYTFSYYANYIIGSVVVNDVAIQEELLQDTFINGYSFTLITGFHTIHAEYVFQGTIIITAQFDQTTSYAVEHTFVPFLKLTNLTNGSIWLFEITDNFYKVLLIQQESNFELTFVHPTNHTMTFLPSSPIQTNIFSVNNASSLAQINLLFQKTNWGYLYNSNYL